MPFGLKPISDMCTPARVYLIISAIVIVIGLLARPLGVSIAHCFMAIFWGYCLSYLCDKGLKSVSWFILLWPLIFIGIVLTYYFAYQFVLFKSLSGENEEYEQNDEDDEDEEDDGYRNPSKSYLLLQPDEDDNTKEGFQEITPKEASESHPKPNTTGFNQMLKSMKIKTKVTRLSDMTNNSDTSNAAAYD